MPARSSRISASKRDKGFATADASGTVRVRYGTSGKTLLSMRAERGGLHSVVVAPEGRRHRGGGRAGRLVQWRLDNPHPEVTLGTLFGKVWYEGYSEPAYVWQSTGGTDDFEAKFSLTPLIFGTLKGTVVRAALRGAAGAPRRALRQRVHAPGREGYVKPAVEIMAALPSVVLGFLAGLWLAPVVERIVPGLFLLPLVLPLCDPGRLLPAGGSCPSAPAQPLQDRDRGLPPRAGGARGGVGSRSRSAASWRRAARGQLSRLAALGARAHL